MRSPGARALSELRRAPLLHTLSLNLQVNDIGVSGAQALATFRDAPALHTLVLNLQVSGAQPRSLSLLSWAAKSSEGANKGVTEGGNG